MIQEHRICFNLSFKVFTLIYFIQPQKLALHRRGQQKAGIEPAMLKIRPEMQQINLQAFAAVGEHLDCTDLPLIKPQHLLGTEHQRKTILPFSHAALFAVSLPDPG